MLKKISRKLNNEREYSKIWITRWQNFVMVWCSIFFVADIIFNHAEHSVELCTTLVISIAAIFVPYLAKSYFGKRNEEENKIIANGMIPDDSEDDDGFKEDE